MRRVCVTLHAIDTEPSSSMFRAGSHLEISHPVHVTVIGGASIQYSNSLALRLRLSAHALRWLGRAEGGEDGMGHCVADKYKGVVGGRIRKRESEHEHLRGEQGGS